MYNQLRIILFRSLLLSALLFSSGMVLAASQSAAANSTTSSQSSTWTEQAEGVCSSIYNSRGSPQVAENPDDTMALAEAWHSHLATKTADALEAISDAPPNGTALIGGMRTYASLSLAMANYYAEHPLVVGPRYQQLGSERQESVREVQSLSASLNTPACYSVVNTPE